MPVGAHFISFFCHVYSGTGLTGSGHHGRRVFCFAITLCLTFHMAGQSETNRQDTL